jgi:hypothetical protein
MVKSNKVKKLNTFCCDCGKKLGQGIPKGEEKKGYGDQEKRRFHGTCKKKQDDNYDFHMSCIYKEDLKNYYDRKKHYNFINKSYTTKAIPTDEITRQEEYKKHMDALDYYMKKNNNI